MLVAKGDYPDHIPYPEPDQGSAVQVSDHDLVVLPGLNLVQQDGLRLVGMIHLPFEMLILGDEFKEVEVGHKGHTFVVPGLGSIDSPFSASVELQRPPAPHLLDLLGEYG